MSALEIVLAAAGLCTTAMVILAMILLTPSGGVAVHAEGTDADGSNLSPVPLAGASTADEAARAPARI